MGRDSKPAGDTESQASGNAVAAEARTGYLPAVVVASGVGQTHGVDDWQVKRPFWWGLVLLVDRDASEVPSLANSVISASPSGLAVKVLHAQDVDLSGFEDDELVPPTQVQVLVRVGERPQADALFSGEIDVPSGVLTVGDAEQQDALEIGRGRWAVQVDCAPRGLAETVRVWLQAV